MWSPNKSPSPGSAKFKHTLSLSIADLSLKGEVERNSYSNTKHKSGLRPPPHPTSPLCCLSLKGEGSKREKKQPPVKLGLPRKCKNGLCPPFKSEGL